MAVVQDFEGRIVAQFGDQLESVLEGREEGVAAFDLALDQREVEVGAARQGLPVNFRATADKDIRVEIRGIEGFQGFKQENFRFRFLAQLGKMKLIRALEILAAAPFVVLPENLRMRLNEALGMPRQHQIFAAGQRAAQAFKGFAANHHDVAQGHLLEPFEILGQVPGNFVSRTNDPVQRHCRDGFVVFHGIYRGPSEPRAASAPRLNFTTPA